MIAGKDKEDIIDICRSYGFSEVKFAKAEKLSDEIQKYKEWIEKGYNADMEWMDKNYDRREDVTEILSNTKSVITLAYNYKSRFTHSDDIGKISRYAWGKDYHNFIPKKQKKIIKNLNELYPDAGFKPYVDTGPVLERQWAAKSGLGWQGKNSLILNRKLGSYFFIAVIFTTLEIESDSPVKDYCGKCTKCLDGCPTGAITEPKVVDSNKCISYWTIESKVEEFPEHIRENLNGWIFGCDICQEVCPWNNHRVKPQIEDFIDPRYGETNFDLDKFENMTDNEFKERFIASPVKRPKLKGMRRNAKELKKTTIQ